MKKKPVTKKTIQTLNAIDSALSETERETLQRHMAQMDSQLLAKATSAYPPSGEVKALKSLDLNISGEEFRRVQQHLEKLDPLLKEKIASIIAHRPPTHQKSN